MVSERWAVRQYPYSYYPCNPYYSYSHAYAWNCSYSATTTLAQRYSPRSSEQPPKYPLVWGDQHEMAPKGEFQKKEKISFDYQPAKVMGQEWSLSSRSVLASRRSEPTEHATLDRTSRPFSTVAIVRKGATCRDEMSVTCLPTYFLSRCGRLLGTFLSDRA